MDNLVGYPARNLIRGAVFMLGGVDRSDLCLLEGGMELSGRPLGGG
jgi:hypothetical protein